MMLNLARSGHVAPGHLESKWPICVSWLFTLCLAACLNSAPLQAEEQPPISQAVASQPVRVQTLAGVSAVALAGLPERVAVRTPGAVPGPSEHELRDMFWRAVQSAVELSPLVRRAQAEHQAAVDDIDEAIGQRWPQLGIAMQSKTAGLGPGKDNISTGSAGINFNLSTPVYDWGRIGKTIASRQHLAQAANASIEAQLENTAFEVLATMVELGKQRIIIDLGQQYENRMSDLVQMLAGIVAVDKGRSSELTQAKARLLQAQSARDNAQTQASGAEIQLRKLIGERPIMIPRTRQWNIRLASLDGLLQHLDDHPDIQRAQSSARAAQLQAQVVRSSSLPQLNWLISKTTAEDGIGRSQPLQTSLAVSWAAFRGGSTRAAERAALHRAEAGRQEAEQQRLDLEYYIRNASHDARTLFERAELYRDLTAETDQIRQAFYQQWYHLGKRTLLDVLSAESDHFSNQVSEISSRFDGYQAIFRQYASAGSLLQWLRGGR